MSSVGAPIGNQNAVKSKRWTAALDEAMRLMDKSRIDGWTTMQAVAKTLVETALAGDVQAIKEIGDRLEGKPKQQIEATGQDGGPLTVQIIRFVDDQQK